LALEVGRFIVAVLAVETGGVASISISISISPTFPVSGEAEAWTLLDSLFSGALVMGATVLAVELSTVVPGAVNVVFTLALVVDTAVVVVDGAVVVESDT